MNATRSPGRNIPNGSSWTHLATLRNAAMPPSGGMQIRAACVQVGGGEVRRFAGAAGGGGQSWGGADVDAAGGVGAGGVGALITQPIHARITPVPRPAATRANVLRKPAPQSPATTV